MNMMINSEEGVKNEATHEKLEGCQEVDYMRVFLMCPEAG